ncbi:MAG: zinc ribbon domain-containing protein [Verrucomicrobiota bacterium]
MNPPTELSPSGVRCPECGLNNPSSVSSCETCGTMLPLFAAAAAPDTPVGATWNDGSAAPQTGMQSWPWDIPAIGAPIINKPSSRGLPAAPEPRADSTPKCDLTGRVIMMEPPHQERLDFDWYRFFTKLMWLVLLVASPFLLLHALLVKLGALPALLAVAGMIYLLRFITPSNLLSMVYMNAALNPLRRQEREMVPVRYFRVRDDDELEWMVRAKGNFRLGNISTDDLVSLWGRWRGGTLFVTRGYNHRTRSRIGIQSSYSWIGFVITLTVILSLVCYFWEPTRAVMHKMQELGGRP